MINDDIKATGTLTIVLMDENGNVKSSQNLKNLIVTVGKQFIASRLVGDTPTFVNHIAIGDSNSSPSAGQTTLGNELVRVAMSTESTSGTATATYEATFNPAAAITVQEAALFSGTGPGIMLSRTTFLPVNKTVNDTLFITWQITIS